MLEPPLLTCWPVLTEACWLLRQRPASIRKLFQGFREGLFELVDLESKALEWIPRFLERYESAGPQLADAALVYLAERKRIRTVFTLDRRDFGIYRLSRNRALTLIPELG
jgi:predicted nucleic acid-binding protein